MANSWGETLALGVVPLDSHDGRRMLGVNWFLQNCWGRSYEHLRMGVSSTIRIRKLFVGGGR